MFQQHDRIYLNDPRSIHHGQPGAIVNVDARPRTYAYQVQLDGSEFAFWRPESELSSMPIQAAPALEKPHKPAMLPQESPYDFDGGFGVGGINRRQPTAAEEMELINAQIRHAEREEKRVRKGPFPHGQLWEPCPICGREPVCLDCGLCEQHCDC